MARVKKRRMPKNYKLMSGVSPFGINTGSLEYREYDPDHNLDDDQWFVINEFSRSHYSNSIINTPFVHMEYDDIPAEYKYKIDYLWCVEEEGIFFQNVTPSYFLKKKFLSFGDQITYEEDRRGIVLKDYPDAFYVFEEDALIFRELSSLTSIFKDIGELYKEATTEETESFLDQHFVELAGDYEAEKVGALNRRRIALAQDKLGQLSENQVDDLVEYIRAYCEGLDFDEEERSFAIGSDQELKHLLFGIEQRFYTTPLDGERRVANSVTKLD